MAKKLFYFFAVLDLYFCGSVKEFYVLVIDWRKLFSLLASLHSVRNRNSASVSPSTTPPTFHPTVGPNCGAHKYQDSPSHQNFIPLILKCFYKVKSA